MKLNDDTYVTYSRDEIRFEASLFYDNGCTILIWYSVFLFFQNLSQ